MARKHYTQFSDTERAFVYGFIRRNAGMAHARRSHFYDKASERSFTFADIAPVLSSGRVIEVHNDLGEWRALIRRQGVRAILSLQTFDIVTVYYNAPDDNHATLNYALYFPCRCAWRQGFGFPSKPQGRCVMKTSRTLVPRSTQTIYSAWRVK